MKNSMGLDVFINPRSVAVIGASEKPGSWGSFIMTGLTSVDYHGKIFPVNPHAHHIFNLPAYKDIRDIEEPVDLAVLAVPAASLESAVIACGQKEVKGITLITAGFAETSKEGKDRQATLTRLAASYGMRVLGPNVSGTFNLYAGFNASSIPGHNLLAKPVAAVCQGGYAFYDMLSVAAEKNYGVGWFIHTGNESDVSVSDFLEHFGRHHDVKAIIMYIEAIRDGKNFIAAAGRVKGNKPILAYKAGRTKGAARAAFSHTGAMAGDHTIYSGVFKQTGILMCPAMELLLPASHALIERPPMNGRRVGIITIGGSWGVSLSDALEENGLNVPEFGRGLQKSLRALGLPGRASVRNPADFGASGLFLSQETPILLAREILASGDVDALVVHGIGRPGMHDALTSPEMKFFLEIEKNQVNGICELEKEFDLPVLIGSYYNPWQSQAVHDLNQEGIRVYNRLSEIAQLLSMMHKFSCPYAHNET
jgi:acyl-CoA synthetase (NDP forming)